jgi:hypothetical protein
VENARLIFFAITLKKYLIQVNIWVNLRKKLYIHICGPILIQKISLDLLAQKVFPLTTAWAFKLHINITNLHLAVPGPTAFDPDRVLENLKINFAMCFIQNVSHMP